MDTEKKRRMILWVVIGVLLAAALLWLGRPQSGTRMIAVVSVGDQTILTIDLSAAKDQEFSIQDETGLPITFQIRDHAIRFLESDCPDKICINTGFLRNDLDVASCLPNRTTLLVMSEQYRSPGLLGRFFPGS